MPNALSAPFAISTSYAIFMPYALSIPFALSMPYALCTINVLHHICALSMPYVPFMHNPFLMHYICPMPYELSLPHVISMPNTLSTSHFLVYSLFVPSANRRTSTTYISFLKFYTTTLGRYFSVDAR
jgi:hypothetical protein